MCALLDIFKYVKKAPFCNKLSPSRTGFMDNLLWDIGVIFGMVNLACFTMNMLMNIDLVDRCVDWIWGKLTDYTHVAYDVLRKYVCVYVIMLWLISTYLIFLRISLRKLSSLSTRCFYTSVKQWEPQSAKRLRLISFIVCTIVDK